MDAVVLRVTTIIFKNLFFIFILSKQMAALTHTDVVFLSNLLLKLTDAQSTPFCIFDIGDFASVSAIYKRTLTTIAEFEQHAKDPDHTFDKDKSLTLNDLVNFKNIMDSAARRNVFSIEEYHDIHAVYMKIADAVHQAMERAKNQEKQGGSDSDGVEETKSD